jgi:hypothetical protein
MRSRRVGVRIARLALLSMGACAVAACGDGGNAGPLATATVRSTSTPSAPPMPSSSATHSPVPTTVPSATASATPTASTGPVRDELLTDSETMLGWIGAIVARGVRRPGYAADAWTEEWIRDRFLEFGLDEVRLDPVAVERWEPLGCRLDVWRDDSPGDRLELPCFPVPFTAPSAGLEAELAIVGSAAASDRAGKIAVVENRPLMLPQTVASAFATWLYDPTHEVPTHVQTVLFAAPARALLQAEIDAGAAGFVGILRTPWETDQFYAPYDAIQRPLPAVWLSASNGNRLLDFVNGQPAHGRLQVERSLEPATSRNVTGVLRGASNEWVIIGSHHDGPWASAVEDASGTAMVLAQARYWSRVPQRERPHNMLFLLNAGHMSGGAGLKHFTSAFADFISSEVLLEVHLEHVAREARAENGRLLPTDAPEWRWWFTSFIAPLEEIVADAICREDLERSFIMPPEGFPPGNSRPPTDAARFHPQTPLVSFATAPMYLFDAADTIEMVHAPSLVPLSRAVIRIVEAMRAHTAAELRGAVYAPPRAAPLPPCQHAAEVRR